MLSGCPVGENWIISSSSGRDASGASATLWLGMRVMALLSRRAVRGSRPGDVTGKDGAATGNVTRGPAGATAGRCHNSPGRPVLTGGARAGAAGAGGLGAGGQARAA